MARHGDGPVRTPGAPVRLGFAALFYGSRIDLKSTVDDLAPVLRERIEVRLVLPAARPDISTYPALQAIGDRIEWRDGVLPDQLAAEIARWDVNLAPFAKDDAEGRAIAELGAASAALVHVPTIAPVPLVSADAVAIVDRHQWAEQLDRLISDPAAGRRFAETARSRAGSPFDSYSVGLSVSRLAATLLTSTPVAAELFRAGLAEGHPAPLPAIDLSPSDIVLQAGRRGHSRVAVVISLFNYADTIVEALDSVRAQTLRDIDLVVVDDRSTDPSLDTARAWLETHGSRFNHFALLRNQANAGLARTRNAGISFANVESVFILDADNVLLPRCLDDCLDELDATGAAFAYPTIELFGDRSGLMGDGEWDPALLRYGNYVDAMALVRKTCWAEVGGYSAIDLGWEDFDFWAKMAEKALFGVRVPAVTARYRVHQRSMHRTITDLPANRRRVIEAISSRHRWITMSTE